MIDRHFYNENLLAFETLIDIDRVEAEKVIFKVYCILQRDKIWINEVADDEEYTPEDEQYLQEISLELEQLDVEYGFRFADFHKLVMQEMGKISSPKEELLDDQDFYDDGLELDDEDSNLDDLSNEEVDAITFHILKSAKQRFDYEEFVQSFPIYDAEYIDQNIILQIIVDKANENSNDTIAQKISNELLIQGFYTETEDIISMVAQKEKELDLEIKSFSIVIDALQQGAEPTLVINQLEKLLNIH